MGTQGRAATWVPVTFHYNIVKGPSVICISFAPVPHAFSNSPHIWSIHPIPNLRAHIGNQGSQTAENNLSRRHLAIGLPRNQPTSVKSNMPASAPRFSSTSCPPANLSRLRFSTSMYTVQQTHQSPTRAGHESRWALTTKQQVTSCFDAVANQHCLGCSLVSRALFGVNDWE
jgi:hypothetical protein